MTNKLVVIIYSLKVPKINKILLYEMKFLVPNYSCLQNPWLGGYRPQITVLSVLCPQLNLLNPPRTKFLGTQLGTRIHRNVRNLSLSHPRRPEPSAAPLREPEIWQKKKKKSYAIDYYAIKAYKASPVNLGSRWGWLLSSTPRLLYPRYPLNRELDGPHPVWMLWRCSALDGFLFVGLHCVVGCVAVSA